MNLAELIQAAAGQETDITPRLVRFLITEGVLLAPTGGRKHASYPTENVERLRLYQQMRRFNQPIGLIRQAVQTGTCALEIAPGLLLLADPSASPDRIDPDRAADAARRLVETINQLRTIKKETTDVE